LARGDGARARAGVYREQIEITPAKHMTVASSNKSEFTNAGHEGQRERRWLRALGRRFDTVAWLALPATLFVAVVMVAPLTLLVRYSLNLYSPTELMVEALTLRNYLSAVTDPYYLETMGTTLKVSAICTSIALAAGFPAAYVLARCSGRRKSWLILLTILPLLVGSVVRSSGWLMLLGNAGVVNAALRWAGIISEPLQLIYTPGAVIVALVSVVLPYMILILASVVEAIPFALEEAASNMGARPLIIFRRVIFPLALPGVIAASALVFILCMNAYATPVLVGGANFKMMAPAVYDQFVRTTNWPFGAALALILLAVTLTLTLAGSMLLQRRYRAGQHQDL
jgi:putative spermidine/putrescine transport system permease protein